MIWWQHLDETRGPHQWGKLDHPPSQCFILNQFLCGFKCIRADVETNRLNSVIDCPCHGITELILNDAEWLQLREQSRIITIIKCVKPIALIKYRKRMEETPSYNKFIEHRGKVQVKIDSRWLHSHDHAISWAFNCFFLKCFSSFLVSSGGLQSNC